MSDVRTREPLVSMEVLERIAGMKVWVRVVAIVALCGIALLVLGAFVAIVYGMIRPDLIELVIASSVVAAIGAVYALPAVALYRYASALDGVVVRRTAFTLAAATAAGRRFWTTAGILVAIGMVIQLVLFVPRTIGPAFRTSARKVKVQRTAADMETVGAALERYALEHHQYPKVASLEELARVLEPRYVKTMPRDDAWGRPLTYATTCKRDRCFNTDRGGMAACGEERCVDYTLSSGGEHGQLDPQQDSKPKKVGSLSDLLNRDLVHSSGRFLAGPPTAQELAVFRK